MGLHHSRDTTLQLEFLEVALPLKMFDVKSYSENASLVQYESFCVNSCTVFTPSALFSVSSAFKPLYKTSADFCLVFFLRSNKLHAFFPVSPCNTFCIHFSLGCFSRSNGCHLYSGTEKELKQLYNFLHLLSPIHSSQIFWELKAKPVFFISCQLKVLNYKHQSYYILCLFLYFHICLAVQIYHILIIDI